MREFIFEQSRSNLTSHAGLSLVGRLIRKHTMLRQSLDSRRTLRLGISHSDVVTGYLGLLTLGKNDFEAIAAFRDDPFFAKALGMAKVPSVATLRLRFDEQAGEFESSVRKANVEFLSNTKVKLEALSCGHVPVDGDVSVFDNSDSRKEGVSWTYMGYDGYAPMFFYLGREGYCLAAELRQGSQHCQRGTASMLATVLGDARRVTKQPLLLRMDGGNDALENIAAILLHAEQAPGVVDYLIKWNPRKEDPDIHWHQALNRKGWLTSREGKREILFSEWVEREFEGRTFSLRRVVRITERTMDPHGQLLMVPKITLEGWWTSLSLSEEEVVALYADHGTSEQFHSEFKTDMDMERLPSGKFATNSLVLTCASLAYNLLRWIGQNGLTQKDAPLRHRAKRRRLKTVMQELMYVCARVIESGRRLYLSFGAHCPPFPVFDRLYGKLAAT